MTRAEKLAVVAHFAGLLLLFGASAAPAQTYVGVDLYTLATPAPFNTILPWSAGGGQVVGAGTSTSGSPIDGMVWGPPAGEAVDLILPPLRYFIMSIAYATDGVQQVGYGQTQFGTPEHALLWNGTAESVIDLHPAHLGFTSSVARGLGGGRQVGWARGSMTGSHAMLWNSAAETAIDLHPAHLAGSFRSEALATDGVQQVGERMSDIVSPPRALLWSGTAASAVDLHPDGFTSSTALGVGGGQQVGRGYISGDLHALLWSGSAASAVDLHPTNLPNILSSAAFATNGSYQVGRGGGRALLWSGTADSAVDLHALLPFSATSSTAYSIDAQGNVFGIAYSAAGNHHAVMWVRVPEPSSLVLASLCLVVKGGRR